MNADGSLAALTLGEQDGADGFAAASTRLMAPADAFTEFDTQGYSTDLLHDVDYPLEEGMEPDVGALDWEDITSTRGHRVVLRPWTIGVKQPTLFTEVAGAMQGYVSDITVLSVLSSFVIYAIEGALYNAFLTELEAFDLVPVLSFGDSISFSILGIVFAFILRAIVNKSLSATIETIPHLYQYYRECEHMGREAAEAVEANPRHLDHGLAALAAIRRCAIHGLALAAALSTERADTGVPKSRAEQERIERDLEGHNRMSSHVEELIQEASDAMRKLGRTEAAKRMDAHVREATDKALFQNAHLGRRAVGRLVAWFLFLYGHIIVPVMLWIDVGYYIVLILPVTIIMYDLLAREMAITVNTFDWLKRSPHDTRFRAWETSTLAHLDEQAQRMRASAS